MFSCPVGSGVRIISWSRFQALIGCVVGGAAGVANEAFEANGANGTRGMQFN